MLAFHCFGILQKIILHFTFASGAKSFCDESGRCLVALATLLSLLPFTRTLGQPVRCEVPAVPPLTQTWLTCYFPEDIGHARKNITVYHYVNNSRPEPILDCWWVGGHLDCSTKGRFQFDKVVSDRLSVGIPRASASQRGQYACQVEGYSSENLQRCEFVLARDNQVACEIYSREETTRSDLTCYFPEDVGGSKKDFAVYHYTGKSRPDPVVDCLWHRGALRCFTELGYTSDLAVTDTLTVQIPYVSDNRTGDYTCQISGSLTDGVKTCQLFVEGLSHRQTQENNVTESSDQHHHSSGEEHHFQWEVGLAVGVVLLVLLAVPAAWKMRRRCATYCCRQSGRGQKGSASCTNGTSRKSGSNQSHMVVKYKKAATVEKTDPQLQMSQFNRNDDKTKESPDVETDDQVTWTYGKRRKLDDDDDGCDAEDRLLK